MNNTKKILYLHGFASSGSSGTVRLLRDVTYTKRDTLGLVSVLAPDIPVDPKFALPFLEELVAKESPDLIIGTSMGGAYAQQLTGYNRICVNPGFELSKKHDILSVGKHKWMSARKDGEVEFHVTKEIIDAFAEMERHQFESNDAANKRCWAMFGVNDDTVDWRKMKEMFDAVYGSEMSSTFEGGHRMNDEVVKKFVLPLAEKILMGK